VENYQAVHSDNDSSTLTANKHCVASRKPLLFLNNDNSTMPTKKQNVDSGKPVGITLKMMTVRCQVGGWQDADEVLTRGLDLVSSRLRSFVDTTIHDWRIFHKKAEIYFYCSHRKRYNSSKRFSKHQECACEFQLKPERSYSIFRQQCVLAKVCKEKMLNCLFSLKNFY
jgi:hypothetical protein